MSNWGEMNCPKCNATEVFKNGHRQGRQYYKCKHCGRPFLSITAPGSISTAVKQLCITMYLKGMGLRGMERVTEIHHTTAMHPRSKAQHQLRDAPKSEEIPKVAERQKLQTLVGNKRNKLWI